MIYHINVMTARKYCVNRTFKVQGVRVAVISRHLCVYLGNNKLPVNPHT